MKKSKNIILIVSVILCTIALVVTSIFFLNKKTSTTTTIKGSTSSVENDVKVSVIIPVYNAEKCLDKCIKSVLNQTLKKIEIICVDDGSPDNCGKMLDQYAKKDDRIKVIHQSNKGACAARNRGIDEAKGEYIRFSDDDDTMEPNACELCYTKAKEHNADILYDEMPYEKVLKGPVYDELKVAIWSGIYKTEFLKKNNLRFYEPIKQFGEDHIFNLMCTPKANEIVCIKDKLYNYFRQNPDNTCNNKEAAKKFPEKHRMAVQYVRECWEKEGYFKSNTAKISFLNWAKAMNYWGDKEIDKTFVEAIGLDLLKDDVLKLLDEKTRNALKKMKNNAKG